MNDNGVQKHSAFYSENFKGTIKKLGSKDRLLLSKIKKKIALVLHNPLLGKPLRNVLKNKRRVHIGSFVLVYEIVDTEIRFLDFGHHDKVYKK